MNGLFHTTNGYMIPDSLWQDRRRIRLFLNLSRRMSSPALRWRDFPRDNSDIPNTCMWVNAGSFEMNVRFVFRRLFCLSRIEEHWSNLRASLTFPPPPPSSSSCSYLSQPANGAGVLPLFFLTNWLFWLFSLSRWLLLWLSCSLDTVHGKEEMEVLARQAARDMQWATQGFSRFRTIIHLDQYPPFMN